MTFTLESLFLVLLTTIVFYVLRGRTRAYVLLVASGYYIWRLSPTVLTVLTVATLFAYIAGLVLNKLRDTAKDSKQELAFFIAVTVTAVAVLVFYKYVPFILKENGHAVPEGVVAANLPGKIAQIIVPVGLSYYMFQVIAYFADIQSGKIQAEKNLAHFALFMSFFPKFVSGPIERPDEMLPQIKRLGRVRLFEGLRLERAVTYITLGYAMKLIIADRVAPYVFLMTVPESYSAPVLWLEIFFYSIQLFADFAGYTYIAIGVSGLLGIELVQNFHAPYLSVSITEFWRRWHMSLSRFLRDYVYISLGGNRKGFARKLLNQMIVFIICGLWHGSGFRYFAWGALHGALIVTENVLAGNKKRKREGVSVLNVIINFFRRIFTFIAVSVMWVFFGAPTFERAITYIGAAFMNWRGGGVERVIEELKTFTVAGELKVLGIAVIILLICNLVTYIADKPFAEVLCDMPTLVRGIVVVFFILAIMVFGMYGPEVDPAQFMYMSF